MKKIYLFFLMLFLSVNAAKAINWIEVITPLGKTAYIDEDSVIEHNGYYFYNIKVLDEQTYEYYIATIQSNKNVPFSAKINTYTVHEYNSLNGDYMNITSKMTDGMEPVTYQSVVYSCYKKAKYILNSEKAKNDIQND